MRFLIVNFAGNAVFTNRYKHNLVLNCSFYLLGNSPTIQLTRGKQIYEP